jgi:hypothetical protein
MNKLSMMIIIFWEHDNLVIWSTSMMRLLWLSCSHKWVGDDDDNIEVCMWLIWLTLCCLTHILLRFIQIYLKLSPLNRELFCKARKIPLWEIILQSKKNSLMRNYLAEHEKYKFHYLKWNLLMWNYLVEQEKNIIHVVDHW